MQESRVRVNGRNVNLPYFGGNYYISKYGKYVVSIHTLRWELKDSLCEYVDKTSDVQLL